MTPENIEAIKNALAPVADKIGQGAEYGWEVLVMGQFAEGVAKLGVGALLLIVACIATYYAFKNGEDKDFEYWYPVIGFGGLFWTLAILFGGEMLYNGLIAVISPEYAALKFLISLGN